MRRTGWVPAAVCAAVMAIGGIPLVSASEQDGDGRDEGRGCNEATIRGDYGVQFQGTRPAPGGLTESVIGLVHRSYDGRGNIAQVDSVKGSITGIGPDRQGFGTYEVNADCTGIARFQPTPGVFLEERLVIVDNGREIRTITASPLPVMVSGVQQRIHAH